MKILIINYLLVSLNLYLYVMSHLMMNFIELILMAFVHSDLLEVVDLLDQMNLFHFKGYQIIKFKSKLERCLRIIKLALVLWKLLLGIQF